MALAHPFDRRAAGEAGGVEPQVGGRIFEEHVDGRRFQWGRVLEWEPPRRVKFTFHPSRDPATAQDVEVRFVPDGGGTASSW